MQLALLYGVTPRSGMKIDEVSTAVITKSISRVPPTAVVDVPDIKDMSDSSENEDNTEAETEVIQPLTHKQIQAKTMEFVGIYQWGWMEIDLDCYSYSNQKEENFKVQ